MKKSYEKPLIEIEEFQVEEDILNLSSTVGPNTVSGYGKINNGCGND